MMGKPKEDGKVRPRLVKFKEEAIKWDALVEVQTLEYDENPFKKEFGKARDLTKKEMGKSGNW